MITQKQIQNLKPGDPLVVQGEFCQAYNNGNILVSLSVQKWETSMNEVRSFHPSCVSLPSEQPKHDPTRLFRNGDIVRYVERDGRSYVDAPPVGATCRVIVGEDSVGMVSVEFKFSENEEPAVHDVPFYHLELITPVEELEPFTVVHKQALQHFQINHGKLNYMTFPYGLHKSNGWYHTITTAKAAAEAECDRLNAEWRKEHGNG